jgi:hypothetical protein
MPPDYLERKADGTFATKDLATGKQHRLVLRTLTLEHRYHDDDPVQGATFSARFANGYEARGTLDESGKARVMGVPGGAAEVRYGPDARAYEVVEQPENPDYRAQMGAADFDALVDKYGKGPPR